MSLKKFLRSRERFIHVSRALTRHEVKDADGVVHVIHIPTHPRGTTRCTRFVAFKRISGAAVLMDPTNRVYASKGL